MVEKSARKNKTEYSLRIDMLNTQGKKVGVFDLNERVFDGKTSDSLMRQAVVAYLANQRRGLAHTKTRGEVRGGGRKPWRQKGTGQARVGSTRSPLWRKGGITFGPRPHSFYTELPQRMKVNALKSALNAKLRDNEIVVLEGIALKTPKTKEFFGVVKNLKLEDLVARFIVSAWDSVVRRASRNIQKVQFTLAKDLTTYEVLNCKQLVFTKGAIEEVQARVEKWVK
ncbi:MAG: 50S ribosomal protein L4 [Candidatus Omnitrophota bacterium]